MAQAIAWATANPTEKIIVSAWIHAVNFNSLKSHMLQLRRRAIDPPQPVGHTGGQNRILSEAQIQALLQYTEKMRVNWGGATKEMVLAAIGFLRQAEGLSPPSALWFNKFLSTHTSLFKVVKTKPIARNRVSAQDHTTVQEWFQKWSTFCDQYEIQAEDIYNFDEKGFRVGITGGETIIIPTVVENVNIFQL
jgi:hypothetical protein